MEDAKRKIHERLWLGVPVKVKMENQQRKEK